MVIQGSRGTPNGHLEAQISIFIGPLWEPHGINFGVTSVAFAKVADTFQVHLFDDLREEILLESNSCMCLNHCNQLEVPSFSLIHNFSDPRDGFRYYTQYLLSVLVTLGHLFCFLRVLEACLIFCCLFSFGDTLGDPRLTEYTQGSEHVGPRSS